MAMNPWDTGSALYRKLLLSALAITGLGIVLSIAALSMGSRPLSLTAVAIILAGLLTHIAGLLVRGRDARRRALAARNRQGG